MLKIQSWLNHSRRNSNVKTDKKLTWSNDVIASPIAKMPATKKIATPIPVLPHFSSAPIRASVCLNSCAATATPTALTAKTNWAVPGRNVPKDSIAQSHKNVSVFRGFAMELPIAKRTKSTVNAASTGKPRRVRALSDTDFDINLATIPLPATPPSACISSDFLNKSMADFTPPTPLLMRNTNGEPTFI